MEHCYYIGIDMDDSNAIISYYQTGMSEPETLSPIAGSEVFQIPLLLAKKKGIGQWFIGEEAKRIALQQNEEPFDGLLRKALEEQTVVVEEKTYDAKDLLALYLKKLILLASRLGNPGMPDFLVITLEKLSRELTQLFGAIAEKLGLEKNRMILLDRRESFYYFAYNQKKELWMRDMYLFDYRMDEIKCYFIERNLRTVPQMVTITEQVHIMDKNNPDECFYRILNECLNGRILSSVYLVGNGFDGDWMKVSLAFLCRGRRAFIGKNLYSKGACYAALVKKQQIAWPYVYMGDNELKLNVSLKVKSGGTMQFLTLISAGENWYEALGECEVILEGTPEVDFWLQLPNSREAKIQKLELADIPERPDKTTRLRISAKPVSDTEIKIVIRDLGFGEIVRASDKIWEYTMSL